MFLKGVANNRYWFFYYNTTKVLCYDKNLKAWLVGFIDLKNSKIKHNVHRFRHNDFVGAIRLYNKGRR